MMKLTKEECLKALARLKHRLDFSCFKYFDGHIVLKERYKRTVEIIEQLIEEHFESSLTREKLEKALDKACNELAMMIDDFEDVRYTWDIDEWKEYLLNETN